MIVNVHEAKTQLSRLLVEVAEGREVVIARAGRPVARLVAYSPSARPRQPGTWRGRVRLSDDFDDLPGDLRDAFHGERP